MYKKKHKTTRKGYLRYRKDSEGKLRLEHCLIWEETNGKIPPGKFVHHIDGNKENNSIENLMLVTPLEHKRIHSGCIIKNDVWCKPCSVCGEHKECNESNWYYSNGYINGRVCKVCFIAKQLRERSERIARGWKRKC